MKRIFRSEWFSTLAKELAAVINTAVVVTTLDKVALDYPNMDKTKYGYEVVRREELLCEHVKVLLG